MVNKKYSYKVFYNKNFINIDPLDFDGEIINAIFYQHEFPYSDVFPDGISATFINCNLDNCKIPNTAKIIDCSNKHYKMQMDMEYWIVDTQGNPIIPRDIERFNICDLSIDPKDIPKIKVNEPITFTNDPIIKKSLQISEIASIESSTLLVDNPKLSLEEVKKLKS